MIDETHDPSLRSWVASAQAEGSEFPIQNLPVGTFQTQGETRSRPGVAIGKSILSLEPWLSGQDLSQYFRLSASDRRLLRRQVSAALQAGAAPMVLFAQSECEMLLPGPIPDYTDFYASIHHATNVGRLFRPDAPLLPNYKHVPIAYHGRASSIVVSGTAIHRPSAQLGEGVFGASAELDYEVELGAFLGPGSTLGEAIPVGGAEEHWVGCCLLNDWSARDIQRWEYQPLGPFLAKNFATTISPWMVTAEALAPFRVEAMRHETEELPYLKTDGPAAFDITLEVWLRAAVMTEPVRLSRAHFREMYWTLAQMIAHHTSNGCPLRPGDLIGSGTVSGPMDENRGCLLELTRKGADPIHLPGGELRSFLEDGDEVILRGYAEREGAARIGFGECRGRIKPVR